MAHSSRYRHIVLFGPPGVGKGAQAKLISVRYSLVHLSTGDLIREEIKKESELGLRVKRAVEAGGLANDRDVLSIILERIDLPEYERGFLMDGFPRNLVQAQELGSMLRTRHKQIDCALLFDAPRDVILARLTGREVCSKCGATYHRQFKPTKALGVCDICQGSVGQRRDDAPDVQEARLQAYQEQTAPLIEYYRAMNVLFAVDANQSIEAVAKEVDALLSPAQSPAE